jgi:hypothetical protein
MVASYPGSTRFNLWDLDSFVRLCSYACMWPCSLRYGLRPSGIRCLNVIGYVPGEIMWPSKSKTQKFLHAFYNATIRSRFNIMYISYNIFFIYLARDQTSTMPLGKVCSRKLPYLAITSSAQTTRRAFASSSSSHAWGLGMTRHLVCFQRLI